ncbi:MAG TPA: SDR family oxidoreductase [Burkholderiales bacterium]|nr:SDR family oxidoreductase [Burkholderiales bacterium]
MTVAANLPRSAKDLLAGKTAVVTAAAGAGIGFAAARRCAEQGARVLLSDKHEGRLARAVDEFAQLTGSTPPAKLCDVTVEADVQALFDFAERELGRIDVLVNNAGLGGERAIVDMADDEWLRIMDVNLTGTFRCLRAALKRMYAARSGAIVNLSSVLGWRAQAGQAHYAASKAGIMALTRCAAVEAAPYNVRINAVAPSLALHPHLAKSSSNSLIDSLVKKEVFGRAADPLEVADVIVFLASDLASYMTGEVVSISSQHP